MPRLTPTALTNASRISPYLPLLLRECRDVDSAKNELRWLREFVAEKRHCAPIPPGAKHATRRRAHYDETLLEVCVKRRARGEPLQYILGTQPFGRLDILCRQNVLIPRPETETYTAEVARRWQRSQQTARETDLRIADFCSGSGCILLLLHSLLNPPHEPDRNARPLRLRGFDVSEHALTLARENLQHNLRLNALHGRARDQVRFDKLDILALAGQGTAAIRDRLRAHVTGQPADESIFDIIVSNPPYIAPEDFRPGGRTSKSVRKYEPHLALVPPPPSPSDSHVSRADQFYPALLRIARATSPKLLVMEVGDTAQALRVRDLCEHYLPAPSAPDGRPRRIEIWRDDGTVVVVPDAPGTPDTQQRRHDELSRLATLSDPESDADVECRAVVVWFDHGPGS